MGNEKKNDLTVKYDYVWDRLDEAGRRAVMEMGEDYKHFLDASKTERLCTEEIVRRAEAHGFRELTSLSTVKPGDKVYSVNRGKGAMLAVIGSEPIVSGMHIVGSHIDSPRLDLKQNPVYEDSGMTLLKTHYYGGIRKYQWLARPLALHGVVFCGDGRKVEVHVGDQEGDPVFFISDLPPHLSAEQDKTALGTAVAGENLSPVAGTLPEGTADDSERAERFKQGVLKMLNEKYGIVEEDFVSAELELVPAGKAYDVGFDRGAVASYGHDDRVCAYAAMEALFACGQVRRTAVALFVDKEEIGSMGSTGMQSHYFVNTVGELIERQSGVCGALDTARAMAASSMLSSDVCVAFDPNYPSVSEQRNNAMLGKGVTLVKYTGSRGKAGANDAHAEFVGEIRRMLNQAGVVWQTSEIGKVDAGGGGTIAYILSNYNMDVLDIGVPVLAMHAPCEVVSKADVYMTSRAYSAFFGS